MDVTDLLTHIKEATATAGGLSGPKRSELLTAARQLTETLETPAETVLRFINATLPLTVVRLGIDMQVFDILAAMHDEGLKGVSSADVAAAAGTDSQLVFRILRYLATINVVEEVGRDQFAMTAVSQALTSSSPLSSMVTHVSVVHSISSRLPWYFERNGYQNPNDAYDGPFQFAFPAAKNQNYFQWLAENPKYNKAFNIAMSALRSIQTEQWFNYFPVIERLSQGLDTSAITLVDVGGGIGHDLVNLKTAHPTLKGRLMVQDLPHVISQAANLPDQIDAVSHDMFTPQPIKNARAYYLHSILHDWPDKQASIILSRLHDAMSGDSILLINEMVVPEQNVSRMDASKDIFMMSFFSSKERTEREFIGLLESCGLEIVKVWRPEDYRVGQEVLLEARRANAVVG